MRSGMKPVVLLLSSTLILGGCAGGEQAMGFAGNLLILIDPPQQTYRLAQEGMAFSASELDGREFPQKLKANIFLRDIAGSEMLTRLYGGKLASSDTNNVKAALHDSLQAGGLLSEDSKSARYQLNVSVAANRLQGAADITVTTHMQFNLIDMVTGETVMQESVAAPGSTSFSEHHLYKVRIGRAMERSIRGNVSSLLERLSKL